MKRTANNTFAACTGGGWQIQYLLASPAVKFVECDGVVSIAQKRGKDL
jgi:hypothetical protein